ncbi:MAG: hypothetical protein HYY37_07105, partial [Candidatus Aenigmarchaeota archaeon]|nr:hypothetical protein [Candidatus Aenigmarchaeota archaeon]
VVNSTGYQANDGWSGNTCPDDFSKVIVTTNCGGVSATFDRTPRCMI